MLPEVSTVTIRRDIASLAEAGSLRRTRGGAMLKKVETADVETPFAKSSDSPKGKGIATSGSDNLSDLEDTLPSVEEAFDAVILPPISGRGADALRKQVHRRNLPFLAESAPQQGGTYLGPDNYRAGYDLGKTAGAQLSGHLQSADLLLICQDTLPNTRERADGFEQGLRAAFAGAVSAVRVNGQGSYKPSLRAATDAFQTDERFNVVFGVNDHSVLAGMDAAERCGRKVFVYAVGGESADFVGRVSEEGPLMAVAALFPEVVGARAIDLIAQALSGCTLPNEALTPHQILTHNNLGEFYERADDSWRLLGDVCDRLIRTSTDAEALRVSSTVAFMPHYPAHDWYRTLIHAMEARCADYGLQLVVASPYQGISRELSRLRRMIARAAIQRINPGDAIIIGEGEVGVLLASEIKQLANAGDQRVDGLTVITNALDVLERLSGAARVKTILTSGEYQAADRCLVGPSLDALFELMRADKAFLSVAGISARFGVSAVDERLALAGTRFMRAAKTVIAMADHTLLGTDANHRIGRIEAVDEVITDDGSLPAERLALRSVGVEVLVASDEEDSDEPSVGPARSEDGRTR